MKKITLFLILVIVITSCSKSNDSVGSLNSSNNGNTNSGGSGNNGGTGNNVPIHDSTLLFALNVTSSIFNDTSLYKNSILISNSSSKDTVINGSNFISIGTNFNSNINNNVTITGFDQTASPSFYANLPINKIQNNFTYFFEIMNSKFNSNTLALKDSTENGIIANLGMPANNGEKNAVNFYYSYQKSSWYRRLDWRSSSNPCSYVSGDYLEGQPGTTMALTPSKPFSISNTSKFVIVFSQNIVNFYYNGDLIDSKVSNVNISLNGCSSYNNGITFSTLRGTLIKNIKVWNRSLTTTEISKL